jgi:hypothetical protein
MNPKKVEIKVNLVPNIHKILNIFLNLSGTKNANLFIKNNLSKFEPIALIERDRSNLCFKICLIIVIFILLFV